MRAAVTVAVAVALLSGCSSEEPPQARPSAGAGPHGEPPPANVPFDYQIGAAYPPAAAVRVVERDRRSPPAAGVYNICYVNAFQTQPGEKWDDRLLLRGADGDHVEDPDWPGELLLDISTADRRAAAAAIVGGWFAGCAARGFRAVEPDNLDSYTRSGGRLKRDDAVAYARMLVAAAHEHGLAVAQKNTPDLTGAGIGFDFAVAEECQVYKECEKYTSTYGDRVYEIEYTDNGTEAYRQACAAQGARITVILRDREVTPAKSDDYHYETC